MNTARGSLAKLKTRLGELSVTTELQHAKQQLQQAPRAPAPVYSAQEEPLLSPRSQQADTDARQALIDVSFRLSWERRLCLTVLPCAPEHYQQCLARKLAADTEDQCT